MAMHPTNQPDADDDTPAISRQVARAQRRQARSLYHRGWQLTQIAAELGVKYGTLAAWKSRDAGTRTRRSRWSRTGSRRACHAARQGSVHRRRHEAGGLHDAPDGARRAHPQVRQDGREGDLNPKIAKRNNEEAKAKRADKRKNFLSREQWQALLDDFHARNFAYQELWWDHRDERTRKILKSRQIGATGISRARPWPRLPRRCWPANSRATRFSFRPASAKPTSSGARSWAGSSG
jgi:uncharacterized protein YjcR